MKNELVIVLDFWRAVQSAGCKTRSRMQCILWDLFLQNRPSEDQGYESKRNHSDRWSEQLLWGRLPTYTKELFELGIPVLGLCYGAQLMMHVLGGEVKRADVREYGKTEVLIDKASSKVFEGVSASTICWMSHFWLYCADRTGIWDYSTYGRLSGSSRRECRKTAVCDPVPSGSTSYSTGKRDAQQFREKCVRMCRRLEDGWVCRKLNQRDSCKSRRRKSIVVHFPAVWILPWQQLCFPRQSETSLPVYS